MKNFLAYFLILTICGAAIFFTLATGSSLYSHEPVARGSQSPGQSVASALSNNLQTPLGILLIQIVVIVAASRAIGGVAIKLGQPRVVGEMSAGILLGPSFLGNISPAIMDFIFPSASLDTLRMFSQFGVILFMFLVGTDVDIDHLLQKGRTAIMVSHASILFPFLLGTTLSVFVYRKMAPTGVAFTPFALFLGVAMSITAFPVLARIIEERGLTGSSLGMIALACAAVDDVTAWCILAAVLAFVKSDGVGNSVITIVLVLVYASLMLFLLRPLFARLLSGRGYSNRQYSSWSGLILAFVLVASLGTEVIGVHTIFGAFLAGVIIPPGALRAFCKERFESVVSGLLVPLFFAFTGIRTQINLLNSLSAWLIAIVIILAAVAGKLGGTAVAARWSGMKWPDAWALGSLMNARGLMELIVLNIGYDLGIISPPLFAILVLMAITTTIMTCPLLTLAQSR